jgi:multidrug resistance efflux pump
VEQADIDVVGALLVRLEELSAEVKELKRARHDQASAISALHKADVAANTRIGQISRHLALLDKYTVDLHDQLESHAKACKS